MGVVPLRAGDADEAEGPDGAGYDTLHTDDLAGRLIEQGGWASLRLPALAEPFDQMGRDPGEALWPEWEDRAAIEAKRALLGERQFAALFQQAPLLQGGTLFKRARPCGVVDDIPDGVAVRGWGPCRYGGWVRRSGLGRLA